MLSKINSNLFNFSFFLSGNKKVNSLKIGAKEYGGATKFEDGIYSNIQGNEYIEILPENNEISIFIPSTMNVKNKIDNDYHIKKSINYLEKFYSLTDNLKYYDTKGSWYSEDNKDVVIEDVTIITLKLEQLSQTDIQIFIDLAETIKREMKQEAVSISINTALAII